MTCRRCGKCVRGGLLPAAMVALAIWLAGCAVNPVLDPNVHVVERGQTLYSIAWHYGLNWHRLARWNNIQAPYTIYPGQRLRLSPPRFRAAGRGPVPADTDGAAPAAGGSRDWSRRDAGEEQSVAYASGGISVEPLGTPAPSAPKPASSAPADEQPAGAAAQDTRWQWPVPGEIVHSYVGPGVLNGIDIGGKMGMPVRAARAGVVVYSGSGLKAYGNLIIVKHGEHYLSAYGFNRRILVSEGEHVVAGEMIAKMGRGPKQKPMLHFEIRHNGEPVDPLKLLPPRG